jgi:lipid II:glycine glycyltransferase (peptidoglycan interpeptide bridge formation enzyme)
MEDNLKKNKMEDDLQKNTKKLHFCLKNNNDDLNKMEDDLKENKKNGKRPKKKWKMTSTIFFSN